MTADTARENSLAGPVVRLKDVAVGYGGKAVMSGISIDVQRGEIVVLCGGSGSGKTTTLRTLIGLIAVVSGSIEIEGKPLDLGDPTSLEALRRRYGVMYQLGALFGGMTLLENVRLPLEEFTQLPRQAMDEIARGKLALVGLGNDIHKLPSGISGGMQKRAAIARALALDPPLVFLDEPSAGLDPVTSADLDQLLLTLNRSLGTTFVLVTHELRSIFAIAGRVVMLDAQSKRMVAVGTPAELRDHCPNPWVRGFLKAASSAELAKEASALNDRKGTLAP
ncbi:MAG: ATP-binding cassette domain-containing protein [Phycisphaerae bacterium]|nr:ATP-binding cassette domain-containing protein [Phycisphaerae bacterium]